MRELQEPALRPGTLRSRARPRRLTATPAPDNAVVPLDACTFRLFDSAYYLNLLAGHGLLSSDNALPYDHQRPAGAGG